MPIICISAITLIFLALFGYFGFIVTLSHVTALITDFIGLGEHYPYDFEHNPFTNGLNRLVNYQTQPYEDIVITLFGAIGGLVAIILLISIIIYVVYLFIKDIKNYGIYVCKERSFLYFCLLFLTVPIIVSIPILFGIILNFIAGFSNGILMIFEYTPLGKYDNYTLYNIAIKPKQSLNDKIFDIGTIFGSIITLALLVLLLKYSINSFRKDITETYHNIEADVEYKLEKKL